MKTKKGKKRTCHISETDARESMFDAAEDIGWNLDFMISYQTKLFQEVAFFQIRNGLSTLP